MGQTHQRCLHVHRLKGFESKLTSMAEQQGQDANVFRALVKENKKMNNIKKVRLL